MTCPLCDHTGAHTTDCMANLVAEYYRRFDRWYLDKIATDTEDVR